MSLSLTSRAPLGVLASLAPPSMLEPPPLFAFESYGKDVVGVDWFGFKPPTTHDSCSLDNGKKTFLCWKGTHMLEKG